VIIDVHTHIVPDSFPPSLGRAAGDAWPEMVHREPGTADLMISGRNHRTCTDQCWNLARRISELPEQGIDRQVLSPFPRLLDYGLNPQDGRDLASYLNETIAGMVQAHPDRFIGLGSVPLQDPDLAARELTAVKAMGLAGVEITTHINQVSPGDERFWPFWREVERLGLCVFVHAGDPTFVDRIVGPNYLRNAVGFPAENTLASSSIVTSGLMEACPDLRVCFSHGAGGFTLLLPRIQQLWRNSAELRAAMPAEPVSYARKLYYDDIFFDLRSTRYLLDMVGTSQVVIGSDYPLMARIHTPEREFAQLGLTEAEAELVGWRNAARFLGLPDAS
jgi:aminocarboxymuconate-semialdehyde decarboxylase